MTTIGRVEHIFQTQPPARPAPADRTGKREYEDIIEIGPAASEKEEMYRAYAIVSSSSAPPEVRPERVEAARQKINDPAYLSAAINGAAGDIVDILLG